MRLERLWVILLFFGPIFGCFFPLESYISVGEGEGLTGYANLPIPVTTISLILIGVTVIYLAAKTVPRLRPEPYSMILLLLSFASMMWSADAGITALRASRLIPPVALAIIVPQRYGTKETLRMITIALLMAAITSLFMSIAVPSLGLSRLGNGYESAWRGAMIHKNITGASFALGILVAIAAIGSGAVGMRLGMVTLVLSVAMLGMSNSGTAMGGLAFGLAVWALLFVLTRMDSRLRGVLLLFVLLVIAAALMVTVVTLSMIVESTGRDMTFTGRTPIWGVVWRLIQQHPLGGYGYGFWMIETPDRTLAWRELNINTVHSHNTWLELWLQLGIVAPLSILCLCFQALGRMLRAVVLRSDPAAPALAATMVFLLIRSMTEVQFSDPFPTPLFFPVMITVIGAMQIRAARAWRLRDPYFPATRATA